MTGNIFKLVLWAAYLTFSVWSCLVMLLSPALPGWLRIPAALLGGIVFICWCVNKRVQPLVWVLALSAALLWVSIKPRNDRNWQPEVSILPRAEINGDDIVVHNIRDFYYRSENDFDRRWVTRKVKLSQMSSVDVYVVYWAGKSIAHVMTSFGFSDGQHIAFSIETRKATGQSYSSIEGFFRNFEIIYVAAEERDLVSVRALFREPKERVYILRGLFQPEVTPKFFLSYLKKINELNERPSFYNTLTTNCTTQVLTLSLEASNGKIGQKTLKYNWKLLLSGYTPEYLYEMGRLDSKSSLEDLMAKGLVNPRSNQNLDPEEFSRVIREGVPKP